jgi:hypothetical protein
MVNFVRLEQHRAETGGITALANLAKGRQASTCGTRPCFRRDTELPDRRPSGKGYRPGSYRRTSPYPQRSPLHGLSIPARLCLLCWVLQYGATQRCTQGAWLRKMHRVRAGAPIGTG